MFIIIIIKIESAVQGWERVRTLYESEYPTPHNQPLEERKRENSRRQKKEQIKPTGKHLSTYLVPVVAFTGNNKLSLIFCNLSLI